MRFTADASHELRTPLAVILSQVELALSRPREAAAYRESLEACGRAATRMKSLVDDLLTLARADSGKLELRVEPIDLARIAEGSVALLQATRARARSPDSPRDHSSGARRRSGTARSSDHQPGKQRHSVHPTGRRRWSSPRAAKASSALLAVEDTGVGIPESDLPLVFDRFHRVDAARSRGSGGSGLGLAICQSIVEAHGGTIAVASTLDHGSRFTVTIPMQNRHRDAGSPISG